MAARLTDKQKKKIIADYVECGSYNAVARKHKIAPSTVKRLCGREHETQQKAIVKKEQNSADILAHMEKKRDKVIEIIDAYLEQLLDPDTLSKATPSQITTALGTLIDKFTMAGVTKTDERAEDDALTRALKEEAERMNKNADK